MKNSKRSLFFLAVSILAITISIGSISQASAVQRTAQEKTDLMPRQVSRFLSSTIRDLGIGILIIDKVKFAGTIPVFTEIPTPKKDLLEAFIGYLRNNGARLVQSGIVCQIVPLSRNLGNHWVLITSLADIPSIQQTGGPLLAMAYDNASLSDVCENIAGILKIAPIVIDPAVKGSVLLSTWGITQESLSSILMTLLDNNDAVLIESQGEYQIVPKSKDLPRQWKILTNLPPSTPSAIR